MPAKGKHRRPKSQRFTRSIAVAGTGGAALALPLMGATGAHAATSQSVSEKAVQSLPVTQKSAEKAAAKKSAAKTSTVRTYSVRVGDYLSKIADEQNVSGGWKKLYADNREAVGDDPSLIHPGLKLSIGKKAAASTTKSGSSSSSSAKSSAKAKKAQKAESKSSSKSTAVTQSADTTSSSGYTLPVSGATVGTGYRVTGSMWSSGYHTGVDFVVPTGTSLKAVAAGTVVSAGWGGAYGNQVVIKLNDGYYAQYAHLSQLSVSAGQTVSEGQQIGLSGATGNVTGPHLHFEIRTTPDYGSDVDPVSYLRSKGVAVG
ncbi:MULTISPECIES: LysM peptidoglycan-binding domain-containing M23 family metallopeptidase [unclassified Streptomyces]|uniref:M23 family metallopeptidase n=1 Tax=unclassified Streptomyces TaxID=2593676 RepID=UPI001BB0BD82|nr:MULTISPECIES: LysM peptidoglycan-binding domain-containing M23 family metallopeptidase [unclassified Streptomyces]MDH6454490.1 murein DD-endopeptidase MepM/ murein hydrolase activator NlpD [Streptomyces sp. SAI-119]MDH6494952.1 murein DD-endopeptidase MepM/ murein hydrolase activator NlpD [Streptomyces sp. SAI-149]QUC57921.1 peptidoglycan DD-metalloendopeptidase family protein [Streptomyces sp. A2-16]